MSGIKIVCIGHTTLDDIMICESGASYFCQPGGGALHSAAGAALWNDAHEVGVVTKLPRSFPKDKLAQLRALRSVDFEGAAETDERGLLLWLLYDADNYRHWIKHHDSSTREEAAPDAGNIPARYIKEARAYHIAPLPLPSVEQLLLALPKAATIQIDPHYEWFFPEYRELWLPVLRQTDILLPSEDEFAKFFGIAYGQPLKNYLPYMREMLSFGPRILILKMGAQGALVMTAESSEVYLVPSAARAEDIVDFTGAGDSFGGSFLYHYADGKPLLDCVVHGMVGSALSLEHRSAVNSFQIPFGDAAARYEKVQKTVYNGIIEMR